ncbi:MAG: dTMP kinase [Planctomycetota bacterium]
MGSTATNGSWLTALRGRFIVFDGPDGSGKSTQLRRLLDTAAEAGVPVCEVREPGGTEIGERIRQILLDPLHTEMDVRCELLLYMASRAQLVAQRIRPALADGHLVLSDRYVSSTLAYQGTAGGIDPEEILDVARTACGDPSSPSSAWPDLTVILDVSERTAARRLNPLLDRMEQKGVEFHRRVRQGFLAQAERWPGRYTVVDASPDEPEIESAVHTALRDRFAQSV